MILASVLTVLGLSVILILTSSFFVVQEGNVGVVYTLGSLSETILNPGLHLKYPFITSMYPIQITVQTDYIMDVPCGTNSGVTIVFKKIEVVNQLDTPHVYSTIKNYGPEYDKVLIFDKITHEMNQFCSKHSLQEVYIDKFDMLDEMLMDKLQESLKQYAPGVIIRNVRLSKPTVPLEVEHNYKKIVESQTEILRARSQKEKDLETIQADKEKALSLGKAKNEQELAQITFAQAKKLVEVESDKNFYLAQTIATQEKNVAKTKAEQEHQLAELTAQITINNKTLEKDMLLKQGQLEVSKLESEFIKVRESTGIEIQHNKDMKYAEYIQKLYTKEYVVAEIAKYISNNTKIYYGDKLPQMYGVNGLIGMINITNF